MLGGMQEGIPPKTLNLLNKHADDLYVSAISSFEIVLKHRLGKLGLPLPGRIWYLKAIELYVIREIDVSAEIAMRSAELPFIHKDPCDRVIISTALVTGMAIVTSDKIIPQYEKVKTIW